jgi:uncharacterized membrane protein YcgQ (UPF0703/DUF1980 family)
MMTLVAENNLTIPKTTKLAYCTTITKRMLATASKFLLKRSSLGIYACRAFSTTQVWTKKYSVQPGKAMYEDDDYAAGDHTGRQQNHIWTKEELNEAMTTLYRHKPTTFVDRAVQTVVCMLLSPFQCIQN